MPVACAGKSLRTRRCHPVRSWWGEGQGPRGMRASKARSGRRTGQACPRRWIAYGKPRGTTRRNGSPRFSITSTPKPCVWRLTPSKRTRHPERRLEDLHGRVHRGAYRPQPSRRVYIPKADGRQRPLAVAAVEDKIVQGAVAMVLSAIYEVDFLGFSYGFRPGRGQHDALDALVVGISSRKVNWILDADIRSFFDMVDQKWMIRFVEHRIGAPRSTRLIRKWMKAGVLEDGEYKARERGT